MADTIDRVIGTITNYDERRGVVTIEAPYDNFSRMCRRQYRNVEITMLDSRPLSDKQRRNVYAMIREIAQWSGDDEKSMKEILKIDFWAGELLQTADRMFSLSNAPMSIVAAFQSWLAKFIVSNDIPTSRPMLDYVDDIESYVFACLASKKCVICGKHADLHHVDSVGMGRDREEIIHEGMEVLPLCREHHQEIHAIGRYTFMNKYHLEGGVPADTTICKIYGLKTTKSKKRTRQPETALKSP